MIYIKKAIISFPQPLRRFLLELIYLGQTFIWLVKGKPAPPPHPIKIRTILKYAQRLKIKNLIETGTYLGETVLATKGYFQKIYSIELGRKLYLLAKKTFADDKNVKIIYGDSARVLPRIVKKINQPCVFWLDAHFSGGITAKGASKTPLLEELKIISRSKTKNHLILIDDAKDFTGKNGYPKFNELRKFIQKEFPKLRFKVENNIMILTAD